MVSQRQKSEAETRYTIDEQLCTATSGWLGSQYSGNPLFKSMWGEFKALFTFAIYHGSRRHQCNLEHLHPYEF